MTPIPYAGRVEVYAVCDTTTVSDSSNYHTVVAKRSGNTGPMTLDTRAAELVAYRELYLGGFDVARGDIITIEPTRVGNPDPALSRTNFAVRCQLTRRTNS